MPLYKKKELERVPAPESLNDDDEIFYCSITGEIFTDYEVYAKRTLLYISMVWTCSMTGKSNLTYLEALQSEEAAIKSINEFPVHLKMPVLYLSTLTQRTCFTDVADDVFAYIKDRYFVGENVEINVQGNKWKDGYVIKVKHVTDDGTESNEKNSKGNEKGLQPTAAAYNYVVAFPDEHHGNCNMSDSNNTDSESATDDDMESSSENENSEDVECDDDDGNGNDEEDDCDEKDENMEVDDDEDNIVDDEMEDSSDEAVTFTANKIRRKKGLLSKDKLKLFLRQHVEMKDNGIFAIKQSSLNDYGINKLQLNDVFDGPPPAFEISVKKVKQETLFKYLTKPGNSDDNGGSQTKKDKEVKLKPKEPEKKKESAIDMSKEIKEWHKPKEDLELEDQKKMPQMKPVEMDIPIQYFGDILMITEFVNSFDEILSIKDFFRCGFTFETAIMALQDKELAGNYTNLIQMLLNILFKLQEEDSKQTSSDTENKPDLVSENNQENDNFNLHDCMKYASAAANCCKNYQGFSVAELPLYSLTVTEVLRLHLLTSGAQINSPGLDMYLKDPDIIQMLSVENVVDLSLDYKMKIVICLINEILMHGYVREIIEERSANYRQAKLQLKLAISTEKRRLQEFTSAKTKLKKGNSNNKQDEVERMDKENEDKVSEYEKEIEKLLKESSDFQTLLGYDRAYRKYIKCESVPGIFVECNPENAGVCQRQVTKQMQYEINGDREKLINHLNNFKRNRKSSNKENRPDSDVFEMDKPNFDELYMCSTDPNNCMVHSGKNRNKWFFLCKQKDLEELIECLNVRGFRESELKQTLQENKENLLNIIARTPGHLLNPDVEKSLDYIEPEKMNDENANFGYSNGTDPSVVEYSVLLDLIVKLEDRIKSRNGDVLDDMKKWHDFMMKEDYESLEKMLKSRTSITNGSSAHMINGTKGNRRMSETSETKSRTIKYLAFGLVQMSEHFGVDNLKQPLGVKKRQQAKNSNKKMPSNLLDKWQQAALQSTSYSQVFLHYALLENSIVLTKCYNCHRRRDLKNMVKCSKCFSMSHLYCIKPALTKIPKGDWYCLACSMHTNTNGQTIDLPRRRRKIFKDESDEDEGIDESDHHEDNEESDEMKLDICATCNSAGELLSCCTCSNAYHVECVVPPLRRAPRGKWYCNRCKEKYEREPNELSSLNRRSLRRVVEARDDLPLHNATLQELLADVMKHKDSWPFIRPVQKNEVPDYYEIINKPMDFGTIKYKLNMGEYKCDADFMEDAYLVFDNCNTYNNSEAEVYKCGVQLCKYFEKKSKELGLKIPSFVEEEGDNSDEDHEDYDNSDESTPSINRFTRRKKYY